MEEITRRYKRINTLTIFAHGSVFNKIATIHMSDFFKLNKNFIGDMNVDQIRRLREVFAANATIYLEVCFVGQDKELIQELARITGAKVYASNDKQGPDDGMDWDFEVCYYVNDKGQVKTCSPEGGGGVW